ncbi:hypothetical protein [Paraburkholderia sp. BL18I3N2]|uniref:hypothetical protein n=1 Tax=Paraburkholderia sp. BL18I3N2 TaxID=1938799 RepID=UPI0021599D6B|nr:hypothetical protein [Paraburkholderia sp. BL18I3N2]
MTLQIGGTAPLVATPLIGARGSKLAPAWYLVGAAGVVLVAMLASKETSRSPLADY